MTLRSIICRALTLHAVGLLPTVAGAAEIFWADPITETFARAFDENTFGDGGRAGSDISFSRAPHLRIEGPIEPGDNEKLQLLLREELSDWQFDMFNQVVVSLNSEGGDFYEGLAMSDSIAGFNVRTFVGPDDICLSSCAIAFLGGEQLMTRGNPPEPKRFIHDTAVVGFHAPFSSIPVSIPVPQGTPLDDQLTAQLAASFYGQAQAAINEIARRMTSWSLSPDFVFTFLTRQSVDDHARPLNDRFVLIDSYARLQQTSSSLVTSDYHYPSQLSIIGAENACSYLTYVHTEKSMHTNNFGMNFWSYVGAQVKAERPFLDRDAKGNRVMGRVETAPGRWPEIITERIAGSDVRRLIPGSDPDSYFFEPLVSGIGAYQCAVFHSDDGQWLARTFNANVHADDQYGVMRGRDWARRPLLDYDAPYRVGAFAALGYAGSWMGKLSLPQMDLSEFPEEVATIANASFDCNGSLDPAGEIICDYPQLAAWDGRMVALYLKARASFGDNVRDDQRAWIEVRDRLCPAQRMDLSRQYARNELARCLMDMTHGRAVGLQRQLRQ